MHTKDTILFENWQEFPKKTAVSFLAGLRVGFERIRASETGKKVCGGILACLFLILWTLVTFRVAQKQQDARFEAWCERFVNDYISMQEAAEMGFPPDPKEELKKQEITALAQFIQAVKRFNFSFDDFVTAAWGMDARTRNPAYPNTLLEVIQQPRQWPGYSEDIIPTKEEYETATRVWDVLNGAEHPEVSSDFVFASFEPEGITLRDTWEISTKTHFWKWRGQ